MGWGGRGKGEGRGIGDMPTDDSKISAYRPEPDRKCVLYFKGVICNARWHGTSSNVVGYSVYGMMTKCAA